MARISALWTRKSTRVTRQAIKAQPALEQGIAVEGGELAEDACGGCEAHGAVKWVENGMELR